MSFSDQEIELIHRYLSQDLSDKELRAFEDRVATSAPLKDELDFQRKLLGHIQAEEKARLKAEMLKDYRQLTSETSLEKGTKQSMTRRIVYGIAASLLLISVFYFVINPGESSSDVFQEYYQAYDGAVILRGDEDPLSEAVMAYNSGDFEKALGILLKEDSSELSAGQRYLLIANSYLSLNQPEKAIEWLEKTLPTSSTNLLYNQEWYLAMAHLLLDEPEEARIILTKIAASNSIYASQARVVLEESLFN